MALKLTALVVILSVIAPMAVADMIVVNGRYIVAKDSIRGYFYRQNDERTVFEVRWSDWSTRFRCEDAYDRTRVEAALLNLTVQMEDATSVDFLEFLEAEGFTECGRF